MTVSTEYPTQTRTRHFTMTPEIDGKMWLEVWYLDDPVNVPHERWPMTRDDLRALAGLIQRELASEAAFHEYVQRHEDAAAAQGVSVAEMMDRLAVATNPPDVAVNTIPTGEAESLVKWSVTEDGGWTWARGQRLTRSTQEETA